jgi:hypothetical protein
MKKILALAIGMIFCLITTNVEAKPPAKGNFTNDDGYACKYHETRDGSKRGIVVNCKKSKKDYFECEYVEREAILHNNQKCGYRKNAGAFYEGLAKKIANAKKGKCYFRNIYHNKCKEAPMRLIKKKIKE